MLSLFDPTLSDLLIMRHKSGGSPVSGEPLPELPPQAKAELELQLQRTGVTIMRSADRLDGWEAAFNAFAECFEKQGAHLSPGQLQLDLPNMLFNFALKNQWIPNLVILLSGHDLPDLTSPQGLPGEAFCAKTDRG